MEERLTLLIDEFKTLKRHNLELERQVDLQNRMIQELEKQNQAFKQRVDQLDKDRITLKRLKEERRTIRKSMEKALRGIQTLEEELFPK